VSSELNQRYAEQIRATGILLDLLAKADNEGLPVASWMVTGTGGLLANCLGVDDVARRASFEAWSDLLGVQRLPDDIGAMWTIVQRARTADLRGCRVDLVAYLDAPFGGDDQ
jgi:hypothetical protein